MTQQELLDYQALKAEKAQIEEMLAEVKASPGHSPEGYTVRRNEVQRLYKAKQAEIDAKLLAIENAIESLSTTERRLMRLRYFQGKKWEDVCEDLCYCRQQVFRIHKKALAKLLGEKQK